MPKLDVGSVILTIFVIFVLMFVSALAAIRLGLSAKIQTSNESIYSRPTLSEITTVATTTKEVEESETSSEVTGGVYFEEDYGY